MAQKIVGGKDIQDNSNEGPGLFPREDNSKITKSTLMKRENILLQNHWTNFNQTWHKTFLGFNFVETKGR